MNKIDPSGEFGIASTMALISLDGILNSVAPLHLDVKPIRLRGQFVNPTGLNIRRDDGGDGHWNTSRGQNKHRGIDFWAVVGQDVLSPVEGIAINFIGSGDKYPMVDITPSNKSWGVSLIRMLYVDAHLGRSDSTKANSRHVNAGEVIGMASDIDSLINKKTNKNYPSNLTSHIHLQVKVNDDWVDPTRYFPGIW